MKRDRPFRDSSDDQQALQQAVDQDAGRMARAEREKHSILGYTAMLGTLAVLFIAPVVAGAYLGRWLDEHSAGFTARWTVSLILIGIAIGAYNVYRYVKDHW